MHIPEGFIDLPTAVGAGALAAGGLWASLRQATREVRDRLVPFAGLTAAFVFALQMLNFPVAAGTSGHLLGGALAAVLLGPWLGVVAVTVVIVVQALLFADGGIIALGLNTLNMAVITVVIAWPVFRGIVRIAPKKSSWVVVASMVAAWTSVVASSIGFSIQYAIGGAGGVDPSTVFSAMVGVHALIGLGEGIITATAVGAVLAARPDLVGGLAGVDVIVDRTAPSRSAIGVFVGVGLAVAAALVVFVAPFANPNPDGLERVAEDTGFGATAEESVVDGPLADYGVEGIENEMIGTALSGLVGLGISFAAGMMLIGVVRRARSGRVVHS